MIWITMLSRFRTFAYILCLTGAASLCLLPAGQTAQAENLGDELHSFAGDFVYAGGESQRQGVLDAIEVAVSAISPGVQDLARKRLRPPNAVPESLHIELESGFSTIELDGRSIRAQTNGNKPAHWTNPTGMRVRVWHRAHNGRIVEKMVGVGGTRKNVYRLSADGSKLHIDVTMSSPMLPKSVKYRLTYRRK